MTNIHNFSCYTHARVELGLRISLFCSAPLLRWLMITSTYRLRFTLIVQDCLDSFLVDYFEFYCSASIFFSIVHHFLLWTRCFELYFKRDVLSSFFIFFSRFFSFFVLFCESAALCGVFLRCFYLFFSYFVRLYLLKYYFLTLFLLLSTAFLITRYLPPYFLFSLSSLYPFFAFRFPRSPRFPLSSLSPHFTLCPFFTFHFPPIPISFPFFSFIDISCKQ